MSEKKMRPDVLPVIYTDLLNCILSKISDSLYMTTLLYVTCVFSADSTMSSFLEVGPNVVGLLIYTYTL